MAKSKKIRPVFAFYNGNFDFFMYICTANNV